MKRTVSVIRAFVLEDESAIYDDLHRPTSMHTVRSTSVGGGRQDAVADVPHSHGIVVGASHIQGASVVVSKSRRQDLALMGMQSCGGLILTVEFLWLSSAWCLWVKTLNKDLLGHSR